MAVGLGFDSHPFDVSRQLILGGIHIEDAPGLAGHSDADCLIHAVVDALLGAVGAGDIGELFSDEAEENRGRSSGEFLDAAVQIVDDRGMGVVNVDCTIVLEAPKLTPYKEKIAANLSAHVGAPVSVKAKRAEGMGAIGRQEGIACLAVAQVEKLGETSLEQGR